VVDPGGQDADPARMLIKHVKLVTPMSHQMLNQMFTTTKDLRITINTGINPPTASMATVTPKSRVLDLLKVHHLVLISPFTTDISLRPQAPLPNLQHKLQSQPRTTRQQDPAPTVKRSPASKILPAASQPYHRAAQGVPEMVRAG